MLCCGCGGLWLAEGRAELRYEYGRRKSRRRGGRGAGRGKTRGGLLEVGLGVWREGSRGRWGGGGWGGVGMEDAFWR